MPEYRLYCINDRGGISKSHEISAPNDEEALVRARALKLAVKCELWEHSRLVAKLPPKRS